ncbi:MAG: hypothetical protein AAF411_03725 [Myxococcota bacterium]
MAKDVRALTAALAAAKKRADRAIRALGARHQGVEMEEFGAANAELKRLERELALAKGQEAALPYPWEPPWDVGAPMPHVVAAGHRVFLLYYVSIPDPNWDGGDVSIVDPSDPQAIPLAIVEVLRCYSHRFGGPNDEVFHGHPLGRRGLDGYGAYEVVNSRWLAEHRRINQVHSGFDAKLWERRKHFFLAFHDEVFECIAEGFRVETVQMSFADALAQLVERVLD